MGLIDHILDRVRDSAADEAARTAPVPRLAESFDEHRYALLVSYRRSGAAVPTPVWFARHGRSIYIRTQRTSAKVSRIRRNPTVLIAPSSPRGRPLGPPVTAAARIVDDPVEAERAERALARKYSLGRRLYRRVAGSGDAVYLAVELPKP